MSRRLPLLALPALLLSTAALAVGCGGGEEAGTAATPPRVGRPALTEERVIEVFERYGFALQRHACDAEPGSCKAGIVALLEPSEDGPADADDLIEHGAVFVVVGTAGGDLSGVAPEGSGLHYDAPGFHIAAMPGSSREGKDDLLAAVRELGIAAPEIAHDEAPAAATRERAIGAGDLARGCGRIAAVGAEKGANRLLILDPATGDVATRDLPGLTAEGAVAWRPGCEELAILQGRAGDYDRELVIVRPDGSHARVLGGAASRPAWSPDGSRIALVNAEGVAIANADGSDLRPVLPGAWVGVAWSPDGTLLALVDHSGALSIAAPDGGGLREVARPDAAATSRGAPDWSPDGTTIAWNVMEADPVRGNIWTADVASGEARRLTDCEEYSCANPAYAPDGRRLAYQVGLGRIWVLDLDDPDDPRELLDHAVGPDW